ncbi:hypothetical protein [Luteimonas aquatica]|uniref:hypothetical protein n=1 Tax=Luteimonas aquatica TaxID=450364 RepID=UPI001F58786B|nr:hypothetical protein [Luteimonas aquatica]
MKRRHVFSTSDIGQARHVLALARRIGRPDTGIFLVARPDIESRQIPDRRKQADTDFVPAAIRGAGYGGLAGMLAAGTAALVLAPLDLALVGTMLIGLAAGALVGAWASALMGSAIPDPVRRKFEDEIAAGRVLVVVDCDDALHERLDPQLERAGAVRLNYDAPSAIA